MDKIHNELAHHGVLGMRWGVRRTRKNTASADKSKGSEDYTKSRNLRKKGSKNLSTSELKELTTRLQLEKQFKDLNPGKYKKGMDKVKAITAAGTTLATLYGLSKTPLGQDIAKAIATGLKKVKVEEAAKWVL